MAGADSPRDQAGFGEWQEFMVPDGDPDAFGARGLERPAPENLAPLGDGMIFVQAQEKNLVVGQIAHRARIAPVILSFSDSFSISSAVSRIDCA